MDDNNQTRTYCRVRNGGWYWTGWVHHKPDLSDLQEPYLSAVRDVQAGKPIQPIEITAIIQS